MRQVTLRAARKRRGWTQEQLEDASGVDQGHISRIERGAHLNPGIDTVRRLEKALRIPPGTLIFHKRAAASRKALDEIEQVAEDVK